MSGYMPRCTYIWLVACFEICFEICIEYAYIESIDVHMPRCSMSRWSSTIYTPPCKHRDIDRSMSRCLHGGVDCRLLTDFAGAPQQHHARRPGPTIDIKINTGFVSVWQTIEIIPNNVLILLKSVIGWIRTKRHQTRGWTTTDVPPEVVFL